jgi:hypothetical protein
VIFAILIYGAIAVSGKAQDVIPQTADDREAYAKAAAAAGKDPVAHVRLALWCEAHDLPSERLKHLGLAVKYDPSYALARGLLGLVAYQGRWGPAEDVAQQIRDDPARKALFAEYNERRSGTPEKADALLKLAAWCAEHGLGEQAAVHYNKVVELDPTREIAWRHLGYKKQGNRWVKPEVVAAVKQNAAVQKLADRSWKTKLEKLRDWLQSKDAAKRVKAEQELTSVSDPRAVPMIWAVLVRGGARLQTAAVQILGQIDGPSASNGLAALAVFSPFPAVRSRAIDALKRRDPREVVERLIAMVHKPYKYEVRPGQTPSSPGELFVEGERFTARWFYQNRRADYDVMQSLSVGRLATADVPFEPFSLQNMMTAALGMEYTSLKNQFGQAMGPGGMRAEFPITINPPVAPSSAAQAARAAAANPQNAGAILNDLVTNPDNRTMPPLMWYVLANQNTVLDHTAPNPGGRNLPPVEFFGPADEHGHPVNPMQAAMALKHHDQIATNPANFTTNLAWDIMIQAQGAAAQADMKIAQDILAARQAKLSLEQKLAMDIQMIEAINGGIKATNLRVLPVLVAISGVDFGDDRQRWINWWRGRLGNGTASTLANTKQGGAQPIDGAKIPVSLACLASDTLVHTVEGPRPIEQIKVGDRVLAQDTSSGKLRFEPVVATRGNVPAATLKVRAGGASIAVTGCFASGRWEKAGQWRGT